MRQARLESSGLAEQPRAFSQDFPATLASRVDRPDPGWALRPPGSAQYACDAGPILGFSVGRHKKCLYPKARGPLVRQSARYKASPHRITQSHVWQSAQPSPAQPSSTVSRYVSKRFPLFPDPPSSSVFPLPLPPSLSLSISEELIKKQSQEQVKENKIEATRSIVRIKEQQEDESLFRRWD